MPTPTRVLLADDTSGLRLLVRRVLEDSGMFTVVAEAGDGSAAIEAARAVQPDLTLLDLSMPGMDGLEALPLIRQAAPGTNVVVMSAFDRRRAAQSALALGAVGYVEKGCSPRELVRQLLDFTGTGVALEVVPAVTDDDTPDPAAVVAGDIDLFAAFVSHDVLSPLAVVTGFLDLLRERLEDAQPEAEYARHAADAAARIRDVLDELVMYARSGMRELERAETDLGALFDEAAAILAPAIASAGADVGRGDLPVVMVDRVQVRQLFLNLVQNAVKFRQAEVPAVIRCSATRQDDGWELALTDNGIGLSAVDRERLFDAFHRATPSEQSGSGLGLTIARRIVERHGGRIWCEDAPDGGSTFRFTVPDAA